MYKAMRHHYRRLGLVVVYMRGYGDRYARAFIRLLLNFFPNTPVVGLNDNNLPGFRMIQANYKREDLVHDTLRVTSESRALSFDSTMIFLPSDAIHFEEEGLATGVELTVKEMNDLVRFRKRSCFFAWGNCEARESEIDKFIKHNKKFQMEKIQRDIFIKYIIQKLERDDFGI